FPVCLLSNWIRRLWWLIKWELLSFSASFRREVRVGAERQQWDDLSSILNSVVLSSSKVGGILDCRGVENSKVKSLGNFIDNLLPTRVNISRRGVLLDSHMCPLCNAAMEDVQHVFFRCTVLTGGMFRHVFISICDVASGCSFVKNLVVLVGFGIRQVDLFISRIGILVFVLIHFDFLPVSSLF
ncbi:RNA-directed DNA polymerase, eukaryota, partial [Tanacetum coccineum]